MPRSSVSKTLALVSSPAMSAIRNGPKNGRRKPNVVRTTSSRLSRVARPSSTIAIASRSSAIWSRLATKPGVVGDLGRALADVAQELDHAVDGLAARPGGGR